MFENTYLVTNKLETFTHADVDAAETALGTRFPDGYREYVTTLGKGDYCGYLDVFPPKRIVANQLENKPPLEEFCELWDGSEFGITPERLAKAIIVATTMDGDSVIFEPGLPESVYVLPESEEVVYKAGSTLLAGLDWLCKPRCSSAFRYFSSRLDRKHEPLPKVVRLSLDHFRDWITAVGEYDHLDLYWNDNPGVSLEMYRLLEGRMDLVAPELGEVTAFYKSFSGYVSASIDGAGNVDAQVVHDADQSNDTLTQIVNYLRSKAA